MPSDTTSPPADAAQARRGPLFYGQPAAVEPARHGAYRFKPLANMAFARASNCIPLMASEFATAHRDYPIVFTRGEAPMPLAVVGLRDQENLFIDAAGQWKKDAYVPSYVRRYPFAFLKMAEPGKFALCIDEASGCLSASEGVPIFENNQPSQLIQNALRFCGEFQQDYERTQHFCQTLLQQGLLVERRMQLKGPAGQEMALDGFQTIDEAKFNALPDAVILDWRQRGWLGLVYAQMMSSASWRDVGGLIMQAQAT